jgi:hypothetical protein
MTNEFPAAVDLTSPLGSFVFVKSRFRLYSSSATAAA